MGGGRVHLDLDGVESFLVLAEEVHFGNAATRLHVSPSARTKRIQRLSGSSRSGCSSAGRPATRVAPW